MLYGIMSMVIGGGALHTDYLNGVSITDVQMLFNIQVDVDMPHETIPGLYISKPSPLRAFADKIRSTFAECGRRLAELQCKDFADYFSKIAARNGGKLDVSKFITALSADFPTFSDVSDSPDGRVHVLSKAQRLVSDLSIAVREAPEVATFLNFMDFTQASQLTVFADNVLPAVLRREGVLEYSPELATLVDSKKTLPKGDMETEIRAVTMEACNIILRSANTSGPDLDFFLRELAKTDTHKDNIRHYCKDTVFY
eukprot:TRINITY_DN5805_c0_g1_i4.p1 TRINITY_DN5805_c0_g1~~TRINITY_DN5805_c0_g1_i4.p1  ORF type:complete len:255 (+),score=57.77 TRINITY_DN5805_c0_g1_i4:171-935(+)